MIHTLIEAYALGAYIASLTSLVVILLGLLHYRGRECRRY